MTLSDLDSSICIWSRVRFHPVTLGRNVDPDRILVMAGRRKRALGAVQSANASAPFFLGRFS